MGGDATSVQRDAARLESARDVTATATGAVHELRLASGTVVREYADPAGVVYAVAWQGPWPPDLRQLLGPYFEPYAAALRTRRRARGPVAIRDGDLVVELGGRARAFVGRVYVPAMLPADVRADAIR